MKIICTTSNNYVHCLKIFIFLFNRNWSSNQRVEIVGYKYPDFELPSNFTFYSMGEQGSDPSCFSGDLRKYFEKQDDWFIWMMDDTFIKQVNFFLLKELICLSTIKENYGKYDYEDLVKKQFTNNIGRIYLTSDGVRQLHTHWGYLNSHASDKENGSNSYTIYANTQESNYRLSTQPSLWNKEFLLKYLTEGLSPWAFELQQPINDGWLILGSDQAAIKSNEGVTKHDIFAYNLHGISLEQIEEMKQLELI